MLKSTPQTAVSMIMKLPMEQSVSVQNSYPKTQQMPAQILAQPQADSFEPQAPSKKKNHLKTVLKFAWLALAVFALYKTFKKKPENITPKTTPKPQAPKAPIEPQAASVKRKIPLPNVPNRAAVPVVEQPVQPKKPQTTKKMHGNQKKKAPAVATKPESPLGRIKNIPRYSPAVRAWQAENYEEAEKIFEAATGVQLLCPGPNQDFLGALCELQKMSNKGTFPKGIKHIVMSHGVGSSAEGTWCFLKGGEGVFEYIDRTVPKGKNALVIVCESSGDYVKGKPAIGKPVTMDFVTPENPAKIVRSGTHEIIGHFLNPSVASKNPEIKNGLVFY